MRHRLIVNGIFTLCFGGMVVAVGHGQYGGRHAGINRPTAQSASAVVGWTGGTYTRQYGDVASNASRVFGGGDLPQPNNLGAATNIGRMAAPPLPQAFAFAKTGVVRQGRGGMAPAWQDWVTTTDLYNASGLARAIDSRAPLMGPQRSLALITLRNRPYYAPATEGTAFQAFFGLRPTQVKGGSSEPVPADGLAGLLERETEQLVQRREIEGLAAFKLATGDGPDGSEQLARAYWALSVVRDLNPDAYVPCLLLLHAALQQHQLLVAMHHLTTAVEREPALFTEWPDLGSYFGDPGLLEAQVRAYLRVGEGSSTPEGFAFQAYCAWVLGDRVRVRQALDRMLAAEQRIPVDPKTKAIRYALAAALE